MGYANPRSGYHEAKYLVGPDQYVSLKDGRGKVIKFKSKRAAKKAADAAEVNIQNGLSPAGEAIVHTAVTPTVTTPRGKPRMLFSVYVGKWILRHDLAESTINNYRNYIECHLLPAFGGIYVDEIDADAIAQWESAERKAGHKRSSIMKWRGCLHTILGDAMRVDKLIETNAAERPRGRGRRTSRRRSRAEEKVITNVLGGLLIAERMALLSGRDDEFVAGILKRFTGIRSGELWGLELDYVRTEQIRIEHQLASVGSRLIQCPPKDESRRYIDWPDFLRSMVAAHVARTNPQRCPCHNMLCIFTGLPRTRSRSSVKGVTMASLAAHLGISERTVSVALRGSGGRIADATRERVLLAAAEFGYDVVPPGEPVWHWTRDSFRRWIYTPAVSGKFPPHKKNGPWNPVSLWMPGAETIELSTDAVRDSVLAIPVKSARARKANASWLPIAAGMTPHGNRHAHRTDLEERGIPQVLINDRIGHEDNSVQGNYSHVTQVMRDRLNEVLTEMWFEALDARLAMCPTSNVEVLNTLLQERARELGGNRSMLAAA
ncbi:hypothetical protein [Nocardia sp. NPDC050175]|uniref:hypothetical protein n=1 Tax=Nocardia sp. NPDC050175 TaxID=3364317 RepID=UPI0037936ACE